MANEDDSLIKLESLKSVDAWEEPMLLEETNTVDIPANLLPGIFRDYAKRLAEATETPESLSVMTILGVLSTILSKSFKVSPKEGWIEPINIYTLIALPPANNKSLVLNACTKPLIEWEREQREFKTPILKRKMSERKTQERIIDVLRSKAAKMNDKQAQQQLMLEIADKEADLTDVPILPLLFANDVTPETLSTLVYEQGGRLAIFSDEGGILETMAGLYSNGYANIDILLKGIDGGEVRIHRKEKCLAINPLLSIVLAVQPAIVQAMGAKRAYLGNGMLERFLYVMPKSRLGYRTHDKPPLSNEIQGRYETKIYCLLNQYYGLDGNSAPIILQLMPAAMTAWRQFQIQIETELREEGRFAVNRGWGGKISGFALRLAGLLHVAECGADRLINESTMLAALQIASLLKEHAIAAFNLMGIDQATEDAKEILKWASVRQDNKFTQSEIVLAMRNRKLGKAERLNRAMQVLRNHHLLSDPIKLATRKPTTVYFIHPSILTGNRTEVVNPF